MKPREPQCSTDKQPEGQANTAAESDADSLGSSLVTTLRDSHLLDSAATAAEQALDTLLTDGILRDIPVVGHALKFWKGGAQLSAYLFTRKLLRFLGGLKEIPKTDRETFLRKLDADPKERKNTGEHLLLLLDRLDDLSKAELLAKAFGAYVSGRISYASFKELAFAIDRCALADLLSLTDRVVFRPNFFDEGLGAQLYENKDDATVSRLVSGGILFTERGGILATRVAMLLLAHVIPHHEHPRRSPT